MTSPDLAKPRRILVVALDNLGDLVFASALTPPLHAAFPDATISIWSKSYTADVARLVPHVSQVIHVDPFWGHASGTRRAPVAPALRSIAAVRAQRFDVAILSAAPWRTAAAAAATRIPRRIGLARHRNRFFLTDVLPAEDRHQPVLREQARLLAPLGVHSTEPRYRLDASRLGAAADVARAALPERYVALHPFASKRDRCVALAEWSRVAAALHDRGMPVLWIGTTRDLNELREECEHPPGYYADRIGGGALAIGAAAMAGATLFAGHDSGPLHVAGAFGVPVVGVFAPGEPDRTFPQGVGPSRMIARPGPADISADDILREIDALRILSAS